MHGARTTTWRSRLVLAAPPLPGDGAWLRHSLSFASCYVYAPRGIGLLSASARLLCHRVKASDPLWLPRYVGCMVELMARERLFQLLFAREALLVPVPGSAPPSGHGLWAAWQLAVALRELGLGREVWVGLERRSPVRKSATALAGTRPSVRQHFESFAVAPPPGLLPNRIVLVDDVVTKGRTLLGAAARLRCELPHADVRAFALVRTMGFLSKLDRLLAPCEGIIQWAGGDARREP
jgi:predicted amidophosphoribosyltransferase